MDSFTSRAYTRLVRSYGLRQEFITPYCPQQNGMIERVIRALKEQCVHRHLFRNTTTRLARHRRVDPLLQHPSASPDPRH